ncbi:MAG: hypothetical protein U5K74_15475 [Gemmatimonadaceae bacterium]|nr:hypothetical protein [Gemmatimonadaceae bacterium]
MDIHDVIYVHIDKKKKFPATALLRALRLRLKREHSTASSSPSVNSTSRRTRESASGSA